MHYVKDKDLPILLKAIKRVRFTNNLRIAGIKPFPIRIIQDIDYRNEVAYPQKESS